MNKKHSIIISIVSLLLISCSTNRSYNECLSNYNEIKIELLNKTIDYFLDNRLIDSNQYFSLFTYPFFIDLSSSEIKNGKPLLVYFPPFRFRNISKDYKVNSLMVLDLRFETSDNSTHFIIGIVHINQKEIVRYYRFDFKYTNNDWKLVHNQSSIMENYYYFDDCDK